MNQKELCRGVAASCVVALCANVSALAQVSGVDFVEGGVTGQAQYCSEVSVDDGIFPGCDRLPEPPGGFLLGDVVLADGSTSSGPVDGIDLGVRAELRVTGRVQIETLAGAESATSIYMYFAGTGCQNPIPSCSAALSPPGDAGGNDVFACCLPDEEECTATCAEMTQAECEGSGGFWWPGLDCNGQTTCLYGGSANPTLNPEGVSIEFTLICGAEFHLKQEPPSTDGQGPSGSATLQQFGAGFWQTVDATEPTDPLEPGHYRLLGSASMGVSQGECSDSGLRTAQLQLIGSCGACCFTANECEQLSSDECDREGGVFAGSGTFCNDTECPSGACCIGVCCFNSMNFFECQASGGVFHGVGASCSTVECSDPCGLPGRRDPEGSGDSVLRGFIIGWAVDDENREISFNHLSGSAMVVNYDRGSASEYTPWLFQTVDPSLPVGALTGTPGVLNLDGVEYASPFDQLLINFPACGNTAMSGESTSVVFDTDLTIHPASVDLREGGTPIATKAHFDVWNENEFKLSGAYRCVTCWDQTLLSDYGIPNHFKLTNLQTQFGKARIDGIASPLCDDSIDAALLAVQNRVIEFAGDVSRQVDAMTSAVGMGLQAATIQYTPIEEPPEASGGEGAALVSQKRVSTTEKGSLVFYSIVELRWNESGELIQDTLIQLTNDYPAPVRVQFYFVNGDAPLLDEECNEFHPGWNMVDNEFELTPNQPAMWSAATGQGTVGPLSPFTVLDP